MDNVLDMAVEYVVLTRDLKLRIRYLERQLKNGVPIEDLMKEELFFLKHLVEKEAREVIA
jgi:hypothetical protein